MSALHLVHLLARRETRAVRIVYYSESKSRLSRLPRGSALVLNEDGEDLKYFIMLLLSPGVLYAC